jgi:hypothetical protein
VGALELSLWVPIKILDATTGKAPQNEIVLIIIPINGIF